MPPRPRVVAATRTMRPRLRSRSRSNTCSHASSRPRLQRLPPRTPRPRLGPATLSAAAARGSAPAAGRPAAAASPRPPPPSRPAAAAVVTVAVLPRRRPVVVRRDRPVRDGRPGGRASPSTRPGGSAGGGPRNPRGAALRVLETGRRRSRGCRPPAGLSPPALRSRRTAAAACVTAAARHATVAATAVVDTLSPRPLRRHHSLAPRPGRPLGAIPAASSTAVAFCRATHPRRPRRGDDGPYRSRDGSGSARSKEERGPSFEQDSLKKYWYLRTYILSKHRYHRSTSLIS